MIALACTVRGCAARLEPSERTLSCARGHSFDLSRAGYWNLLQPQDRRSARPGDAEEAVDARARWLDRGLALPLVEALVTQIWTLELPARPVVLDAGCGDGFFLSRLAAGRALEACGVDLSIAAVRRAVRRMPEATWIVANADRRLPLADASVDLALSIFGRRHGPELARVLRPAGRLIAIVPGADDLIELREAVLGQRRRVERVERVVGSLAPFLELCGQDRSSHGVRLDEQGIRDALRITYRGARTHELARAAALRALDVTLSAELLLFRRPITRRARRA